MSNYQNLKNEITRAIKDNGNQEITGSLLQEKLLEMVDSLGKDYKFRGVATPDGQPITDDTNVFYVANTVGTYPYYGGLAVADGEIAFLTYNGSWTKVALEDVARKSEVEGLKNNIIQYEQNIDIISIDGNNKLITIEGEIKESTQYSIISPILLKKDERIIVNNGYPTYKGQDVSVIYQCNSLGDFINPIIYGDSTVATIIYKNTTNSDIYIGICCYTRQAIYNIEKPLQIPTLNTKVQNLNDRLTRIDGNHTVLKTLNDIGIHTKGKYINILNKLVSSAEKTIITNPIYLTVGDVITIYSGGNGIGLISYSKNIPDYSKSFTIIRYADNMDSAITYTVVEDGYYIFSGRDSSWNELALTVEIEMQVQDGGRIRIVEDKIDKVLGGETKEYKYTLDDINGVGALIDKYVHWNNSILSSQNTIITKPIYLYKGDKIQCSTGGTGLVLFSRCIDSVVDTVNFNLVQISPKEALEYTGIISEDGWYVFSGRINRDDGTNLIVNITAYRKEKSIIEQLEDDGNDSNNNKQNVGISIGANEVKDNINSSPWFDEVDSDGSTYGTYLDDKIDSIPAGNSFIFISDVHYIGNNKESAKLIDYVRRRLGIKTIIHGGDVLNEAPTIAQASKEWLDFNKDFVFRIGTDFKQVCGDHDHNGRYADTGQALSYQFIQRVINGYNINELSYDTLYDQQVNEVSKVDSWTDNEIKEYEAWKKMHYYYDDNTINTRFIILHTGWTGDVGLAVDKLGSNVLDENNAIYLQLDFLYKSLISCPNNYNIIVAGHNTIGNKSYNVTVNNEILPRYNVNEIIYKGGWVNVALMLHAYKDKKDIILSYRDWSGSGLKKKHFDFTNIKTNNTIICIGGDVHWDIMGKSSNKGNDLSPITIVSDLDNIIATEGVISKNDIPCILTMTDGGDRGHKYYRGITTPPTDDYNDDNNSVSLANAAIAGTLDAQAFDVITITKNCIYCTRIGSGKDRKINILE